MEIGAADGIENNTAWLLVAERSCGVMVEGNLYLVARAKRSVVPHSIAAEAVQMFVTRHNVGDSCSCAVKGVGRSLDSTLSTNGATSSSSSQPSA